MFGSRVLSVGSQRVLSWVLYRFPPVSRLLLRGSSSRLLLSPMTAVTFVDVGCTNTLTPVAFLVTGSLRALATNLAPSPLPLVEIDGTFRNPFVFSSYEPLRPSRIGANDRIPVVSSSCFI